MDTIAAIAAGGAGEPFLYRRPESVHVLPMLRKPVHDIPVIGGNALRVALAVADDILLGQAVFLTQIGAKLHRLVVDLAEIGSVRQIVLAYLKGDMGIIAAPFGAGAAMPAPVVPRERLVGCNRTVGQFSDKGMDADLPPAGLL